ncbi:MAG: exo-alpha-sialidase [Bacteroidales bacterium]|nr:exo-alpha-sialidase [Bacteroidales bacterium]
MKRAYLFALAALVAAACSVKETPVDTPETTPEEGSTATTTTSINAVIDNGDTKTAYTVDETNGKAYFSWKDNDEIDVVVKTGDNYSGVRFVNATGGTEATFSDGNESGELTVSGLRSGDPSAELSDWAFYPSRTSHEAQEGGYNLEWTIRKSTTADQTTYPGEDAIVTIDLPSKMNYLPANPMALVPLIGKKDTDGTYRFTPMTGVLGIKVANMPSEVDFVSIQSNDASLAGSFHVFHTANGGKITQGGILFTDNNGISLSFSGAGSSATFYFPVAEGTIPAGLTVTVGNSSDPDDVMTVTTKKPLTITNGKITLCPQLTYTPKDQQWADFKTGQFKDDFIWNQLGWDTSTWIPVTIQRSGLHQEKYRISNPYTAACTTFSYTPYTSGIETDPYFVFHIDGDNVTFDNLHLGVEDKPSGGKPMMISYRSANAANTKIVRALTDGTPLELQFGAFYSDPSNGGYYYTRDDSNAQKIHLVIDDSTPESWNSIGTCTFIDNIIWPFAGLTDPVERDIQQYSHDANRFRIAKPYPASDADEWFEFNVSNPNAVTSVNHYTGVTVEDTENSTTYHWKAVVVNGAYNYTYSNVMSTQANGLPLEVQIGPCYRDSEGVFASTSNYGYEIGGDQQSRVIDIIFPHVQETWTSIGTGRYMDEWLWSNNTFAPYNVEVEIWRSDLDANRYRVANPYTVANTAFKRTAISGADDYLFLSIDPDTGLVTYETLKTGMDRSGSDGRNLAAAHPTTWNSLKGTSIDASTTKVAAGTPTAPLEIQMGGVYYDSADNTHYYTYGTGLKHLWFPGWDAGETWTLYCEGTYQDVTYDAKINSTDAIGTVNVTIQQSSINPNRYRVANPYRDNVESSLLRSTYDEYLYFQIGNGRLYFEPFRPGVRMDSDPKELAIWHPVNSNLMGWSQGGSDFTGSSVVTTNTDGSPKKVQLGAHYFDIAGPTPGYCYTRQGSAWPNDRIYITFGSADKAVVSHSETPLKSAYHNPVATISLPTGTLERMVVKISGIDLSMVAGVRLWQQALGGWMHSGSGTEGYAVPDGSGVVTIDSFSNATISGDIDLNFWITGNPIGSGVHFTVQEVVVDGVSLPIVQEDIVHLGGILVNNGGDTETIRGTATTINSFRIPALVTSNAGTLIAAYDIRYDNSSDLQGDIDVGVKRSTDGGKTWSPIILAMDMGITGYESEVAAGTMTEKNAQLNNGIGDPCLLVDENTGRLFCFAVWAHGHYTDGDRRTLAWAGTGYEFANTPQLMMVYSDDDGLTWSEPVSITRQIKKYDWRMTFQGPGRGITMKDGTLVIPIQHQEGNERNMHGLYPLNSGIAYSTDHGLTWHAHTFAHAITSEAAVAEIEPGTLLLTMRDETGSHARRNYVTTNLGRNWTAHASNGQLIEPTCEASLLHVNASDNVLGKDLLLFSNPHSTTGRNKMTIQVSEDKGVTWPHSLLIDAGGSLGYSCLTMVDGSTVGILYESSRGNIFFQAIPLTEIVK